MATRLKPGDVLEVSFPEGSFGYVQFLGKHVKYGEAIAVWPVAHSNKPSNIADDFRAGYVTFYPASAAVRAGLARVIGSVAPVPLPSKLRRAGARVGTVVKTWIVMEDGGEAVKSQLSLEERQLPIAAIWNHEMLLHRIAEGWTPEQEGQHGRSSAPSAEGSSGATSPAIVHYLYLEVHSDAEALAKVLNARGLSTTLRRSADDKSWLILVREVQTSPDRRPETEELLRRLVAPFAGEYDGWESQTA